MPIDTARVVESHGKHKLSLLVDEHGFYIRTDETGEYFFVPFHTIDHARFLAVRGAPNEPKLDKPITVEAA